MTAGARPNPGADAALHAAPDGKRDAVFDRTSGWTGGDVCGTADLGHGRVLWLFGDTWIGKVAHGAHAPGSRMVNNSLGLHVATAYFTYAAKGHAPLSRRGELLISYVVNAHDFGAMFRDATIYRPRFLRIPLPKHAEPR